MRPIGFPSPPARPPMPSELVRARSLLSGSQRPAEAGEPFAALLAEKVGELAALQAEVQNWVTSARNCHGPACDQRLTAVQQADIAFSTMLQVRDKLIEAYREIQQIQI